MLKLTVTRVGVKVIIIGFLVAGDPDEGCRIAIEIKTSGMLHHHFLGLWGRGRVIAGSGEQAAVRPIIDFGRWWTARDDLNFAPAEHPAVTGGFVRGDGGTVRSVRYCTCVTVGTLMGEGRCPSVCGGPSGGGHDELEGDCSGDIGCG